LFAGAYYMLFVFSGLALAVVAAGGLSMVDALALPGSRRQWRWRWVWRSTNVLISGCVRNCATGRRLRPRFIRVMNGLGQRFTGLEYLSTLITGLALLAFMVRFAALRWCTALEF
jgi:hypothetical protein